MDMYSLSYSWLSLGVFEVALFGVAFFAAIYLSFGLINALLTHKMLPTLSYGGWLNPKPVPAGQIRRELALSAASVLIFGIGTLVPWGMLKLGWTQIDHAPSNLKISIEILILIMWNELHFYINHRLLHTPILRRFHLPHHRSVITTPWATYAFHPLEALMLGSVPLLPMLLHDFSFTALLALPLISLLFNNIGHSNYDFLPSAAKDRWWLNGARRHHQHHISYHGNYGFMFPFIDRALGTALPIDRPNKLVSDQA